MSDSTTLRGIGAMRRLATFVLAFAFFVPALVSPAGAASVSASKCCTTMPAAKGCCCPLPTPCRTERSPSSETTTLPGESAAAERTASSRDESTGRFVPASHPRVATRSPRFVRVAAAGSDAGPRLAASPRLASLRTFRI